MSKLARFLAPLLAIVLCLPAAGDEPPAKPGDEYVFKLFSGGEIRGKFVNVDQRPYAQYIVETPSGGRITLEKGEVEQFVRKPGREVEYERLRPTYPDTVEGHMALAQWCEKNFLHAARKTHLERVIQLDPEHEAARRALSYRKIKGQWITHKEYMETVVGKTYVPGLGWVLPQEVKLLEAKRLQKDREQACYRQMDLLHSQLNKPDRRQQATAELMKVRDPYAVKAIAFHKDPKREKNPAVRTLFVRALGNIESYAAQELLAETALLDPDDDVRYEAIQELAEKKLAPIAKKLIGRLGDGSNDVINRAAYALYFMEDKSATGPLIDALVSTHVYVKRQQERDTYTFSTGGGGGFNTSGMKQGGTKTEVTKRTFHNQAVLDTLRKLSGVNFDFNVDQWKAWYAAQQRSPAIGVRRD
jgi:hypothetical protein